MPVSPSPGHRSVIVATLRAAGCVFAEDEADLLNTAARTPADLDAMVERRVTGLPLEQVVGWAAFAGLRIEVDPGVFVPRRRTEFLVKEAASLARAAALAAGSGVRATVVVDLCCGSGAVGVALATVLGDVELHATDIEPAAVRCARRNVATVSGRVYQGDLYDSLPRALRGRVHVLAANTPYVPTLAVDFLPSEARDYEPLIALDGGADGLDIARRVSAAASKWLAPGGFVLIETSESQAPRLAGTFARDGLTPRVASSEEIGATVVIGTWRPPRPGARP